MRHSSKKAQSRPLRERVAAFLDIPTDWHHDVRLELQGRHTLTVHGCRRILDFTPTLIRLAIGADAEATTCPPTCAHAGAPALEITGAELVCTAYLAEAVGIEGRVDGIRFLPAEDTATSPDTPGGRR